jgi:hypothetical protein
MLESKGQRSDQWNFAICVATSPLPKNFSITLACRLKSAADFHPPFISMTFATASYSDFGRRARSGGLVAQENESGTIRRDPAGV